MSKMSQLHAELSEQANELGYETLEEACQDGYHVEFNTNPLTHEESATLVPDTSIEQEKAHRDYLERKELYIYGLKRIAEQIDELGLSEQANTLIAIANFMNEGEH